MFRPCALLGTFALVCSLAAPARAVPITGQTLIATGGDVVVTFASNEAGYSSELFLDGEFGERTGALFNNATTPVGTSINLGSFDAGTELVFRLLVQQTGDAFYTGPASRNLDGLVHAVLQDATGQLLVGFEDLGGGGDFDYDDLVIALTSVNAGTSGRGFGGAALPLAVDEPGSLLMLGGGLAALGFVMKRQTARGGRF